jgi:hypothetical protein
MTYRRTRSLRPIFRFIWNLPHCRFFDNCQHHHGPSDFESQALPIRNFRPVTRACAREAVADGIARACARA